MFCPKCGAQNPDGTVFCSTCGAQIANNDPNPRYQQYNNQQYPAGNQYQYQQPGYGSMPMQPQYPMKWHKFLIYFMLFASMVINLINSILYFTGTIYEASGGSSRLVYAVFDGLKVLDIFYGLALVFMGVMALITRIKLANYKKSGPKLIVLLYILGLSISVIYIIGSIIIFNNAGVDSDTITEALLTPSLVSSLVTSVVMTIANSIYYNKRKELFKY